MPHPILHRATLIRAFFAVIAVGLAAGCRETPKPQPEPGASVPRTAPAAPDASAANSSTAASQPARSTNAAVSKPAPPTYTHEPPYRVDTTVTSPDDPQPGWLRIEALADDASNAHVTGVFPEPNKMDVDTTNVARLSLDLSMLPLRAGRRRILRIDGQAIEIMQRHRGRIVLERSPTGLWTVLTKPPEDSP